MIIHLFTLWLVAISLESLRPSRQNLYKLASSFPIWPARQFDHIVFISSWWRWQIYNLHCYYNDTKSHSTRRIIQNSTWNIIWNAEILNFLFFNTPNFNYFHLFAKSTKYFRNYWLLWWVAQIYTNSIHWTLSTPPPSLNSANIFKWFLIALNIAKVNKSPRQLRSWVKENFIQISESINFCVFTEDFHC